MPACFDMAEETAQCFLSSFPCTQIFFFNLERLDKRTEYKIRCKIRFCHHSYNELQVIFNHLQS